MSQTRIADLLLAEISGFAQRLQRGHPLMQAALEGRVSPGTVARYLAGVRCLFEHTPMHLETAASVAGQCDLPELVAHFRHKQREEDGHSAWAESDLVELERVFGVTAVGVPNSMLRWVAFTGEIVRTQPCHYLVYMLFAEHITVQAGTAWVKALADHCSIPLSALSSIAKHVELDQFHAAEGRDQINRLLGHVADPGPFVDTLRRSMYHFEAFFDELNLSVAQRPSRAPRSSTAAALASLNGCQG